MRELYLCRHDIDNEGEEGSLDGAFEAHWQALPARYVKVCQNSSVTHGGQDPRNKPKD